MRQHHALRVRSGAARELDDREALGVVGRALPRRRTTLELVEAQERRVAGLHGEEGLELRVDDHQRCVRVRDPSAGLGHELLDGPEAHREREAHERASGQPRGLDGGDERAGRRTEQRDMDTRPDAAGLERGGHALGVFVELRPGDGLTTLGSGGTEERHGAGAGGCVLDTREDGSHEGRTSAEGSELLLAVVAQAGTPWSPGATAAAGSRKNRDRGRTRSAPSLVAAASTASSTWDP